jgi:hypothetical protein
MLDPDDVETFVDQRVRPVRSSTAVSRPVQSV